MEVTSFCCLNFEKFLVQFPGVSSYFKCGTFATIAEEKYKVIKYSELKILMVKAESSK